MINQPSLSAPAGDVSLHYPTPVTSKVSAAAQGSVPVVKDSRDDKRSACPAPRRSTRCRPPSAHPDVGGSSSSSNKHALVEGQKV
jgi:hypothetical protein